MVRKAYQVVRDNRRHQWEKKRVHASWAERAGTGATERDTGSERANLVFHAQYREIAAPPDLAEAFGVPPATPLVERTYRTRHACESTPVSLTTSYLVRCMIAANPALLDHTNEPWPGGTQHQLHTVGIEVGRIEERVTARAPTPEERCELELAAGTPVILLRKTSYDIDERVVDICRVTLPGDRTELVFTTPLERW
ncbi:UTRA domain-containing protein [Streptomyces sp. A30]|uniref:UTRA domain-containing protein n=1 Tax=Streptomyces sp. A30 TaxID=2789273 RepID=UPI003980A63F